MAKANSPVLTCSKCSAELPPETFNTPDLTTCPACSVTMHAAVFPAMFHPIPKGRTGEALLTDEEASCFYHPAKKADIACENCGRFLCALCDIQLGEQHLCSSCVELGKKKGRLRNLNKQRVLYDESALALSLVPLLMWPVTIITAPVTLFMVFRYWKKPISIVSRTKIRFVFAFIFAAMQIAAWATFLIVTFARR